GKALMPELGAKHVLVMFKGSTQAPNSVTRTRAEAKRRAEEALRKLKAGVAFEVTVLAYSDEPDVASRKGDLGRFKHGVTVPPFEDAVRKLAVGETSGVVETPFGFHVIVRTF